MESVAVSNTCSDFEFTDADFQNVRKIVHKSTGINLSEAKRDMVYSRLARRLRQLNLQRFSEYLSYISGGDAGDELIEFTNAITTNLTSFFRENHHFEHLAESALPDLIKRNADRRRIRIWCCAASTGEEPYSIAMVVKEVMPKYGGWDIKILATDLDTNVLETAKNGVYNESLTKDISDSRRRRFFLKGSGSNQGDFMVRPELKELITFKKLNLIESWPLGGPLDIIFCRNVVIYFNKDTQRVLLDRFAELMAPEGHLYMGHSESLNKISDRFELIARSMYRFSG